MRKLSDFFLLKIKKPIAILFLAHLISGMAQGISLLAVPWYFAKMGLSSKYNFYYGCLTVFILFWGLYAGTLVDKYARIKVFVCANLIQFAVLACVTCIGMPKMHLPMAGFSSFWPSVFWVLTSIIPTCMRLSKKCLKKMNTRK